VTPTSSGPDFVRACQVANQLALAKVHAEYGIKKIFTFHSTVEAAESFVAPGAEGIGSHLKDFHCASIDGSMNMGRRRDIMDEFEDSPLAILSNAKCLTEGVDSPLVDCVAFLSPKEDRIGIVQAIGRAMRKVKGKKLGYVLVPLYVALEENETLEEAGARAKFETVLEILQSLREIDQRFADEIYELVQPRARAKGHRDWKQTEHVKFLVPNVLLQKLVDTIAIRCLDKLIQPWEKRYAELVAYKETHGHCDVPFENGASPLGGWCAAQRERRKRGDITPEQIAQLDAIGFCWHLRNALWDKKYAELVAYKETHGDCDVPQSNGSLGLWCSAQRDRKAKLSPERLARLDALGFCWNPLDAFWDKNYIALVAFKEANGHCNVPKGGGSLADWCFNVKARRRKGTLTPEQITQLNSLGFCWNNREARWDKNYAELVAYKEAHGHCNVPVENSLLGSWCSVQRCSKARLTPERIARLDALGFCWDVFGTAWEKSYAELVAYKKANGDCDVPNDGSSLRVWIDNLRRRRKRGVLRPERIAQLDELGFRWVPKDSTFGEPGRGGRMLGPTRSSTD
jgi:Helicase associated domain/Helicase conserved C-terminal domain